MRRLPPRIRACFALGGAWAAFFAPLVFSARVPYERDILMTMLPLRQYLRERLAQGQWPQWYPYELLGVPFTGSIVASPFHPQALLFLVLSPAVAAKWVILLSYLLGLAGAYRLARQLDGSRLASVTGACVFAFGGYAVSLNSNPTFLVPLLTAPWALAASCRIAARERAVDVASFAVWWALVFLGGDVQLFAECGVFSAALLLACGPIGARTLVRFSAAAALGALLTCAELLPALWVEGESNRAGWSPSAMLAGLWAFHPIRFWDFLLPGFMPIDYRLELGARLEGQPDFFASSLFVGTTAVLFALAGLARRSRVMVVLGSLIVAGCWLAMGHVGGLLEPFWRVVPVFSKFRFPEKFLGVAVLALGPLVAAGADVARRWPARVGLAGLIIGVGLLITGLLVSPRTLVSTGLQLAGVSHGLGQHAAGVVGEAWSHGLKLAALELLATGAVLMVMLRWRAAAVVLPILVFAELFAANGGRIALASPAVVDDAGEIARAVADTRGPGAPVPRALPSFAGTTRKDLADDDLIRQIHLWLLPDDAGRGHVTSFSENSSAERARVLSLLSSNESPDLGVWRGRLNVCFRVSNDTSPPRPGELSVAAVPDLHLAVVRQRCLPRAYLARAFPVASETEARARMRAGLPEDLAVWEGGPPIEASAGDVRWLEADPEHLRLEVKTLVRSALVVSDTFATGWTATLDGRPVPIYATNAAVRGIEVPSGQHLIDFNYTAPGFALGLICSLTGVIGCVVAVLLERRRRTVPPVVSAA